MALMRNLPVDELGAITEEILGNVRDLLNLIHCCKVCTEVGIGDMLTAARYESVFAQ